MYLNVKRVEKVLITKASSEGSGETTQRIHCRPNVIFLANG